MNKFYSLCCDIMIFKQGGIKSDKSDKSTEYTPMEFSYVKNLFKAIFKCCQNSVNINLPESSLGNLNLDEKKSYDFLVAGVVS